jgi:hypothetical protein
MRDVAEIRDNIERTERLAGSKVITAIASDLLAALKVVECVQTRREIEQAIMDTRKLDNHADALRRRTILVARLQDAEKAEDVAIDAWKAGE